MTNTAEKFRAVFFAVIMVTSMVAAGVALTGSAAAANAAASNSSFSPNQVPAESTNEHTLTLNATDVNTSGDGAQVFSVRFNNPDAVDLGSSQITNSQVNDGAVTVGSTNFDTTNDVVNVTLEDDTSDSGNSSSDDVSVTFNVTNVAVGSSNTSDVDFGIDANDDGDLSDTDDAPYSNVDTLTIGAGGTTEDTFVRAQVTDQDGNSIATADTGVTVDIVENGTVVESNVELNNDGRTRSVPVEAGRDYTVELNGGAAATLASASTVTPQAEETLEIDVTIQRILNADELEVVDADPDDASTEVGQDVRFDVLANDTNQQSGGPTGPVSGTDIDATIVSATNMSAASIDGSGTNTTNTSGIASFNVTSTVPQTVTVQFNKSGTSVSTNATASFGAVEGNNTITGEVRDPDAQDVSDATVYAVETTSNQSLAFSENNRDFAVDTTLPNGEYVLNGLQPSTEYNIYVIADGFNRIPPSQTASEVTDFVAKNQTETTGADGDTTNADLVVAPSDAVFDYRLDVTLTDASPDAPSTVSDKEARIPTAGSVTAEVDVDRRRTGSTGSFDDAPAGVDVSVAPNATGILDPDTQTASTDTSGTATVTLDGEQDGLSNVTAEVTNVEDTTYNTTGSEQASVTVFGTAEITGQVVNEEEQALQEAEVELLVRNASTGAFETTNRTATSDVDGRYNFLDVEAGPDYRVRATTLDSETGTATVDELPVGTTTRDIVVIGAEPTGDLAPYTNDNGVVDAGGLQDAAADFRSGDISPTVLQDAAAAFRSGNSQV